MYEETGSYDVKANDATTPLEKSLQGLSDAIARIDKRAGELVERLAPVTVSAGSEVMEKSEPEALTSPTVSRIRKGEKALRGIEQRLSDLLNSLEV